LRRARLRYGETSLEADGVRGLLVTQTMDISYAALVHRDEGSRAMAEEETNLNAALLKICDVTRYGTVEGVAFDLRHQKLDLNEWLMPPIGIIPISRPSRFKRQPFLWFPWFGPFRDTDVERTIEHEIQFLKEKHPKDSPPSVESLRHTYTPDAMIEAGDKIEIDRVVIEGETTGLHHEHDVQGRLAYIRIVKPSGATHLLEEPIVFTGASATWTGGYNKILQKINRRLCAYFGIESIHDPKINEIAKSGILADAEAAQGHRVDGILRRDAADADAALLHAAILARTNLDALLRHYARRTADRIDRKLAKESIRYMIDEACLVGYRWGRAEADMRMKPLAMAAHRSRAGARKGGRISVATRRQNAAQTWKPVALKLAKEIREKNPRLSNTRLVARMMDREGDELPGVDTLEDYVSDLIQLGQLPPKKR
jgi:hypothetical protein